MRQINLYIAGSLGVEKTFTKNLVKETLPNRLVSFAYPTHLNEWLELTGNKKGNVLIDSGAFSAWNRGQVIDLDEYIAYCHDGIEKCEKQRKNVRVVCLDVIPGKKGETANLGRKTGHKDVLKRNKDLINDAARRGYENMMHMKEAGITPIHVFHQGEDWMWLDKMLEQTDYIGISPANDLPSASRNKWMESVFEYLYKNGCDHKTHGFAVNAYDIIKRMPWESCDAASWVLSAAYGNVFVPMKGYITPDFSRKGHVLKISSRPGKPQEGKEEMLSPKFTTTVTPYMKELLEQTGYSLEEIQSDYNIRKLLNARYLKLMQRWLNEYKKTHEYRPKRTLL